MLTLRRLFYPRELTHPRATALRHAQRKLVNVHHPRTPIHERGRVGTPEQVAVVARAYKVFYQKEGEGDAYLINHSSISYLMDPSGRFARVLPYGMSPEDLATQVRDAMKRG